MGGRNVADSMAPGRLEFGAERPGVDKSEKQAAVSGRIGIGAHRHRRLAGGVGEASGNGNAKIVCNRRERSRSKPAASEGSCGGRSEWRAQSIAPNTAAVAIHREERPVNSDARTWQ